MRKLFTTVLLAATLPALAIAGPFGEHRGNHDASGFNQGFHKGPGHNKDACGCDAKGVEHFKGHPMGNLNLTPEQQTKMRDLMIQQMQQHRDISHKYYKLSDKDQRAMDVELKQSRDNTQKAMRALLTPEQQKEFDTAQKAREDRSKEWKEFQEWKAQKATKQ